MRKHFSGGIRLGVCLSMLIAASALIFLLTPSPVLAQIPTGTILGVVRDSTGGVVPGAQVTVTQLETDRVRTATTTNDGEYRVTALPPGHYSVKVEKGGFKTLTQSGITLDVASEINVNSALEVGSSTQEVTVTGEAPLVETTTSSLGGLVNDEDVAELPLNGRNFVDLALMQPGITNDTNFQQTTGQGGTYGIFFSSNGAPVRSNTFTIDGANMANGHGTTASGVGTTLGVDGIKEYRVITSGFSAEYGQTMGSQVVIVSKGGTNQFHGDVFEYFRNSALDARNFFDYGYLSSGKRLPQLQRNNFGGSFGGPIQKDKTFFWAVYEGLRQNLGQTILDNVFPTGCNGVTNNSCAVTAANPQGNVPAVMQPLLALFPAANVGTSQFTFPFTSPESVNFGQIRIDHTFSNTDSMFGRYTVQDPHVNNPLVYPQLQITTSGRDQYLTLAENHTFSPTVLNTARVSYSRANYQQVLAYPSSLASPAFALVAGHEVGQLVIGGLSSFRQSNAPNQLMHQVYTLSDDVFYTRGKHAFKFGTLMNRVEDYFTVTTTTEGSMTFANANGFLNGQYTQGQFYSPGYDLNRVTVQYTMGFYAQDDWRVRSNLTLNLGLRYEFGVMPVERYGRAWAVRNQVTDTAPTQGSFFANPSLHNFGPRVGFAWDVFGNGKTAVRSAFGMYYDLANNAQDILGAATGTPPLSNLISLPAGTLTTLPVNVSGTPGNSLHTQQYFIKQPTLLQWNMTIEQQLTPSFSLSAAYVGTRGMHLWDNEEGNPCAPTAIVNGQPNWLTNGAIGKDCPISPLNTPAPAGFPRTNGRLNTAFGTNNWEATNADSSYNGLQVIATKRVSHGLQLVGSYTFSKVLDDLQGEFGPSECAPPAGSMSTQNDQYPENRQFDKGPACFNATHNFRMSLLYHLPEFKSGNALERQLLSGWWMGSLVSWESGLPFNVIVNTSRSLNDAVGTAGGTHVNLNTATVAPNQTGPDGTLNTTGQNKTNPAAVTFVPFNPSTVITGNPQNWFNPLMFSPGPVGFLGTSARDMLQGPHLSDVDFSISKDTAAHFLGEQGQIQFRVEFFNILNHANFGTPSGAAYAGTLTDTGQFAEDPVGATASNPFGTAGAITNTVTTSRQIQLSLKFLF